MKILCAEKRWRASTKVQFPDDRSLSKYPSIMFPFFQQSLNVRYFHHVISCDPGITSTIGAETFTKWQMNVNAYSFFVVGLFKASPHAPHPFFCRKRICLPRRYCGITGISRRWSIVLLKQRRSHCWIHFLYGLFFIVWI